MTGTAPACAVVQFPHPGPERFPRPLEVGAGLPWNTGVHGRKFLLSPGTWTVADGTVHGGDLTFWGEWEAQTQVVEVLRGRGPGAPRALQRPWFAVTDGGWRQNTDPLVFGDVFAYTNCRQQTNSKLRRLAPGSLVLFGSKLRRGFVLDTVLVVADAATYRPVEGPPPGAGPDARTLVCDPLALDHQHAESTFTWYRGATPAAPANDMFSFVPALPYRPGGAGFARPRLDLEPYVVAELAMAARHTPASLDAARAVWNRVVDQVLDAGLVLATHLSAPHRVTAEDVDVTSHRA